MNDIEDRIKRYAVATIEATDPVTADEARTRAGRRSWRSPWMAYIALAAAIAVVAGSAGLIMRGDSDGQEVASAGREFPMTLDGQRDWMVAVVNGDIEATDEELKDRFSEEFLSSVPPETLRQTFESVIELAPWTVLSEVERRENVLAVQLQGAGARQARLTMMTGSAGRVEASTILMAEPCAEAVPADAPLEPALAGQLEWTKALLASTGEPSDQELVEHLAPSFLSAVPVAEFRVALEQVRALGPFTYRHHEGPPLESSLTMRVGIRTGEEARLTLATETRPPHQVTGFVVRTQQPCRLEG
jgi:hypothetical protein